MRWLRKVGAFIATAAAGLTSLSIADVSPLGEVATQIVSLIGIVSAVFVTPPVAPKGKMKNGV
jgi:hypothetical protein